MSWCAPALLLGAVMWSMASAQDRPQPPDAPALAPGQPGPPDREFKDELPIAKGFPEKGEDAPRDHFEERRVQRLRQRVVPRMRVEYVTVREPANPEEEAAKRKYAEVTKVIRDAKTDADKEKAVKALTALLEESFARDLQRRERDVAEIEERVKKLREQIEKRRKAKDEIIALRVKTIVNELEGLDFPGFFQDRPGPESEFRLPTFPRPPKEPVY
jgi:hypothetical protein